MQISPPPAHNVTESMNESHQRQPAVHEKRRPLFLLMHSYITHQTTEPRAVCFVAIFATRAKGFGPRTWQPSIHIISKILYIFIYYNALTLYIQLHLSFSENFEHGTAEKSDPLPFTPQVLSQRFRPRLRLRLFRRRRERLLLLPFLFLCF